MLSRPKVAAQLQPRTAGTTYLSSELFLISMVNVWANGAPEGSSAQGRAATKVVRSLFLRLLGSET